MGQLAIQCECVGKKFCKSLKKSMLYGIRDIISGSMGRLPHSEKLRPEEFWAIDGVDFQLQKGSTFGIIGPNGSGKTTLLKMLNGIFMPDKGRITVDGKIGALIQVGAGFHPMLSGRENIYINGSILGMTKKDIDRKFKSIVEFADMGDFLDSPVKHYSSGMYVRLGFAIAVHSEPEILLIDEILAVGDKEFQIKCYQKMHDIRKNGTTIILVSHNEYVIREHTDQCLYLDYGKQRFIGSSEEAINLYVKEVYQRKSQKAKPRDSQSKDAYKRAEIITLRFLNHKGLVVDFIESGDPLTLQVELIVHEKLMQPIIGVNFYGNDQMIYSANSQYDHIAFPAFEKGRHIVRVHLPQCHLPTNDYLCSVVVSEETVSNLVDWHDYKYKFVIARAPDMRGLLKFPTKWEHQ